MKKLSNKILSVIIGLVLITILSVAGLFLIINNLRNNSADIVRVQVENQKDVSAISKNFAEVKGNLFIHINGNIDATYKLYEGLMSESFARVDEAIVRYEERNAGSEEKMAALSELKNNYDQYVTQYATCIDYSRNDKKDMAQTLILQQMQVNAKKISEQIAVLDDITQKELEMAANERDAYVRQASLMLFICVALIIVSIVASVVVCNHVVKPIKTAVSELNDITEAIENYNGDLTTRISVTSKDEVSVLAKGINRFLDLLQDVIGQIALSSGKIADSSVSISENVSKANEGANDTSATMQELSAGMEEVSATVETVNGNMEEIQTSVSEIADNAVEGTHYAGEIKERAEGLKRQAVEAMSTAKEMLAEIDEAVSTSVEDAKQISEISSLTENILGISSQTNLLALNASIEAARAGEAGKGFAVVADEIRMLADSSRDTANDIQRISSNVINNVNELAANAMKLLEFVNTKVMDDYNNMENVGVQYYDDAVRVDDLMNGFKESTQELNELTKAISSAISDISVTVGESAKGVTQVAETTSDLVFEVSQIMTSADANSETVEILKEGVDKFKVF